MMRKERRLCAPALVSPFSMVLLRRIITVSAVAGLAACAQMPASGPTVKAVVDADSAQANTYVVIDLTPSILQKLAAQVEAPPAQTSLLGWMPTPAPQRIGTGDSVTVTIWEAGAGGLFFFGGGSGQTLGAPAASSGARFLTLPAQTVDLNGSISVPYAGQVTVAGLTPADAQSLIVRSLKGNALQPQAMLSIVQNQSNLVTVSGDVVQPGRVALNLAGSRLLDVIAQSGGSKWPAYDTAVLLSRGGTNRRIRLDSVVNNPDEDVLLQAGDLVHLIREPRSVAVLGATNNNALVPFDTEQLTLAEALAKAGGLRDEQASAKGVFVFRFEPASVVRTLVPGAAGMNLPDMTPVVFRANLRQPSALFLSESFRMQDKDMVYVANTDSVQLEKLVTVLRDTALILSPAYFFTR